MQKLTKVLCISLKKQLRGNIKSLIPAKLNQLAKIFKKNGSNLYLVGGFVRDCIIGENKKKALDFDLASNLNANKIMEMLADTAFKVKLVNKKLGTIHIFYKDKIYFEHTTFRKDNYILGHHTPNNVKFVYDLETDAKRRDFTINCIYYDILNNQFIDIYNGQKDIKNKTIKCIESPEFVFKSDGLRILRLVRFFCQLQNFKIDKHSLEIAKQNANLLNDISQERISKELHKCFENLNNQPINKFLEFFEKLINLEIFPIIFNKTNINFSNVNYESFNRLLSSINKKFVTDDYIPIFILTMIIILEIDYTNIESICHKMLMYKGLQIERTKALNISRIIKGYFDFLYLDSKNMENNIAFIQKYNDILNEIYKFIDVIHINKDLEQQNQSKYELEGAVLFMKLNDIPFTKKDLPINGWDIKRTFPDIEPNRIKEMLEWTFQYATKHYTKDKVQILFALERKEKKQYDDIKSLFNID